MLNPQKEGLIGVNRYVNVCGVKFAARTTLPTNLDEAAAERLDLIVNAHDFSPLKLLPGYHFEALKGDRIGQYSIRINSQYRICFGWDGEETLDIEIVDYH